MVSGGGSLHAKMAMQRVTQQTFITLGLMVVSQQSEQTIITWSIIIDLRYLHNIMDGS